MSTPLESKYDINELANVMHLLMNFNSALTSDERIRTEKEYILVCTDDDRCILYAGGATEASANQALELHEITKRPLLLFAHTHPNDSCFPSINDMIVAEKLAREADLEWFCVCGAKSFKCYCFNVKDKQAVQITDLLVQVRELAINRIGKEHDAELSEALALTASEFGAGLFVKVKELA